VKTGRVQGRWQEEGVAGVAGRVLAFKPNWRLTDGPATAADVHEYLKEAFERYGPPLIMKQDGNVIFQRRR